MGNGEFVVCYLDSNLVNPVNEEKSIIDLHSNCLLKTKYINYKKSKIFFQAENLKLEVEYVTYYVSVN